MLTRRKRKRQKVDLGFDGRFEDRLTSTIDERTFELFYVPHISAIMPNSPPPPNNFNANQQQDDAQRQAQIEAQRLAQMPLQQQGQQQGQQQNQQLAPPPGDLMPMMQMMAQIMRQSNATMELMRQDMARRAAAPVMPHVIPDIARGIPDFEGTEGPEAARTWLKKLRTSITLHQWTTAVAFEAARIHLKSSARNWYEARVDQLITWDTFVHAFEATFVYERTMTEKWTEMTSRVQKPNETVAEFFHHKVRLCKSLNLTDAETMNQVAAGLRSRQMSDYAMAKSFYDLDHMLRSLNEYEKTDLLRRDRFGQRPPPTSAPRVSFPRSTPAPAASAAATSAWPAAATTVIPTAQTWKSEQRPVKFEPSGQARNASRPSTSASTSNSATATNQVYCYNCRKVGHFSRDCTEPRKEIKCYKCNKVGHVASRCHTGDDNQREMSTLDSTKRNSSKAKFLKNVILCNRIVNAFIDPGSSVSTMKNSVASKYGLKIIPRDDELIGFGAQPNLTESHGVARELLTVDSLEPRLCEFLVVPDAAQNNDVIIGRNFTELEDIFYIRVGDVLVFREAWDFPFSSFPEYKNSIAPQVIEKCVIKPNSIMLTEVRVGLNKIMSPVVNYNNYPVVLEKDANLDKKVFDVKYVGSIDLHLEPVLENELNVDKEVTQEQKKELLNLINEYRVCVAKNLEELGCTNEIEMEIKLKPNTTPICAKPYKLNPKDREDLNEIIDEYKRVGIVTETDSPYTSPAFLTRKKGGDGRMVVDYRVLNEMTERCAFPMPNFDDAMGFMRDAKLFITLDLASGFHQIPLKEESKKFTAFITEDHTGQFERTNFGLANAPFFFAKLMKKLLGHVGRDIAFNFFDDTIIFATTWSELIFKLRKILDLLKKGGLTLNLKKCFFAMPEISFVGYIVGHGQLKPDPHKIASIVQFPVPQNAFEVFGFERVFPSLHSRVCHDSSTLKRPHERDCESKRQG